MPGCFPIYWALDSWAEDVERLGIHFTQWMAFSVPVCEHPAVAIPHIWNNKTVVFKATLEFIMDCKELFVMYDSSFARSPPLLCLAAFLPLLKQVYDRQTIALMEKQHYRRSNLKHDLTGREGIVSRPGLIVRIGPI
jgi:hypothetical protein